MIDHQQTTLSLIFTTTLSFLFAYILYLVTFNPFFMNQNNLKCSLMKNKIFKVQAVTDDWTNIINMDSTNKKNRNKEIA